VVGRAGAVKLPADLEPMLNERGAVTAAAVPSVLSFRVLERGSSLWKAAYQIG
jgi:hypothetical protein